MQIIKTPKGLENFTPWSSWGTLNHLRNKHPDIKLYFNVKRKSDGEKFKAGQWIKLKSGEEVKIVAFDYYDYPLPIEMCGKPICKYENGRIETTVFKSKYYKIKRAIYGSVFGFTFTDLEEYNWMKE